MSGGGERRNSGFSVLFIGDRNLGNEGLRCARDHFDRVTGVICGEAGSQEGARTRATIRSRKWDVCISFYNDMVLLEKDLEMILFPLNIHPASPLLPGVGYDTLPLIENHGTFGATLHRMIREVDAGRVVDIIEDEVPEGITYTNFRPLTQKLCLRMLRRTFEEIRPLETVSELEACLERKSGLLNRNWSPGYVSRSRLARILSELRAREPAHRVFR